MGRECPSTVQAPCNVGFASTSKIYNKFNESPKNMNETWLTVFERKLIDNTLKIWIIAQKEALWTPHLGCEKLTYMFCIYARCSNPLTSKKDENG